jgi:GT2 family glycosyltransferase
MTHRPDSQHNHAPGEKPKLQVGLIIPTCNAADHWQALLEGIQNQSVAPHQVIVVDSSSIDGTALAARSAGFTVLDIAREEFNHGATRQFAAQHAPSADVLIYLTQDAIPFDRDSFKNLVSEFGDPEVGAAFGRQVPCEKANPIEAHARLFNYPDAWSIRSWESRKALGFKSIFFSNSFGAYRREALMSVGGFPSDAIFGEDTLVVARLHRAGWKTVYAADALVQHSHAYSMGEEFKRYFDIGVLHAREPWLIEQFGSVSSEGRRFVFSELRFLCEHDLLRIPSAFVHTISKYVGYKLGRNEKRLPAQWKYSFSMNKGYWRHRSFPEDHAAVSYGSVKKKVAP